MAPKKPRNRTTTGTSTVSLKRVKVTVEMKRKIVELKEQGMCVKDIARTFARPSSTICTILKNREKFMEVDASSGLTRISTKRLRILDDVEWLLLEWIRERHRLGESIDEQTICERARTIAAELVKALPGSPACTPPFGEEEEFKASRGWFERFKQRTGMQDACLAVTGGGDGLLVAARQSAAVNQGLPPLLTAAATVTTSSSSSSSSGGGGGDVKENPDRLKTVPQQSTTDCEPPPATSHRTTVDSADENSSSSSSSASSEPGEGQQRAATVEVEQQLSSSAVSEMLRAWQSVAACIERYHPNRAVAAYVTAMFNEYGVAPVRLMWERMQEQQRH
ncbi:major centromere autoantigen B-like [Anopheles aquasalis]|uniref:major centromere autoantigen B-like n=1 Tax=Anopheles aquasalis TaxID=42839 RepID=UPI00215B3E44|nr:major centromere autoantigen B-like [Anopheles aquasalis]